MPASKESRPSCFGAGRDRKVSWFSWSKPRRRKKKTVPLECSSSELIPSDVSGSTSGELSSAPAPRSSSTVRELQKASSSGPERDNQTQRRSPSTPQRPRPTRSRRRSSHGTNQRRRRLPPAQAPRPSSKDPRLAKQRRRARTWSRADRPRAGPRRDGGVGAGLRRRLPERLLLSHAVPQDGAAGGHEQQESQFRRLRDLRRRRRG